MEGSDSGAAADSACAASAAALFWQAESLLLTRVNPAEASSALASLERRVRLSVEVFRSAAVEEPLCEAALEGESREDEAGALLLESREAVVECCALFSLLGRFQSAAPSAPFTTTCVVVAGGLS